MAIRVKLDYLLLDRQMTLTELAERVGMTLANLSILKTNKAKAIRFSTLDALCRELKCQPGELLEWTRKGPAESRILPRRHSTPKFFERYAWMTGNCSSDTGAPSFNMASSVSSHSSGERRPFLMRCRL